MTTSVNSEATVCPTCGKGMPAGILEGFCPACLIAQGADTERVAGAGSGRFQPPPLDEIAKLFPQLEILGLLGAGGMGAVYKARQATLDRIVALKVLPAGDGSGGNFSERFNREARALARLGHPNIVAVYEFGQLGELSFFIMEFVDGANLRQLEQANRLSPREALQIIPQICDALQYAHDEGVVHRDIKPENVLIDRKGRVKIADFGLAKILGHDPEAARLTAEGQVMGTPHYMAPEQVERPLTVDHRADIYSLGVVFYEMLTGDLPLGKFSPPSRKVAMDVRLDEVVLRALENDPARRYQKASEVKSQVQTITGSAEQSSQPGASKASEPSSLRWMGFPIVVEQAGKWLPVRKEMLKAFGIFFGLLTIAFGSVSAIFGHNLFGWVGISGWQSLLVRLVLAAAPVAWGTHRTLRRSRSVFPKENLPRTPQGTAILSGRPLPENRKWWWTSKQAAIRIGLLCVAVIALSVARHEKGGNFKTAAQQTASRDAASGAFIAELPNGGRMELLAIADAGAKPNEWWQPDGRLHTSTTFKVENAGSLVVLSNALEKDLIFRFTALPEGTRFPLVECDPASSFSSGDTVLRNGLVLDDTWPMRMAWPDNTDQVTIRLGISFIPWRTITTSDLIHQSTSSTRKHGDPNLRINFHQAGERDGQTLLTLVRSLDDVRWQSRIVAVDTNGVEFEQSTASKTLMEKNETWTSTFRLPLASVAEFRAQIRPLHWVEFRNIVLKGKGLGKPGNPRPSAPIDSPRQLATNDLVTGGLSGALPGGGALQLLAISDAGAAPNEWWLPDGTAIPNTLYELIRVGDHSDNGWTNKDFLFRWRDLPEGADGPQLKFVHSGGTSAGGEVLRDGALLTDGYPVRSAFQPRAVKATLRAGFSLGDWQTISAYDRAGTAVPVQVGAGVPEMHPRLHQVGENSGHTQVTILLDQDTEDWGMRVVATDTSGMTHIADRGVATPSQGTTIWTYDFHKLPFALTAEIRVQVRPVHWVEFRDVALVPRERSRVGKSNRAFKPTVFGAVHEVQITELFDFDREQSGIFPTAKDGSKIYGIDRNKAWSIKNGFDAAAGTNELRLLQMGVVDVSETEWETITPNEMMKRLNHDLYLPASLPSKPGERLPVTHAFRTRKNGTGLLQITAFHPNQAGATLRYKLVERAHFE